MTPADRSRPLTKLEKMAVNDFAERIREVVESAVPAVPDAPALEAAIRDQLTEDGPMLPRLLGAMFLESVRTGDKSAGEDDPPLDGMLGKAIDGYLAQVWPLVLSPNLTSDEFRKAVLD